MVHDDPLRIVHAEPPTEHRTHVDIRRALRTIHVQIWTVDVLDFGEIKVLATDAHDARRQARQIFANANTAAVVLSVTIQRN